MKKLIAAILVLAAVGKAENVTITWDLNPEPNVVRYNVYYGQTNQAPTVRSVTVPPYQITALSAGTNYIINVSAIDSLGLESDLSTNLYYMPVATTPPIVRLDAPASVGLLALLPAGPGKFNLSVQWAAVTSTNLMGYRVYSGDSPAKTNAVRVIPAGSTSTQFQGLLNGRTNYFAVEAVDKAGVSSLPTPDYTFLHTLTTPGNVRNYTLTVTGP